MAAPRWTAGSAWPALAVPLPFLLAAWLGLGPGPIGVALAAAVVLALALHRAGREELPRFGRRPTGVRRFARGLLRGVGWLLVGTASALALAALWAGSFGAAPPVGKDRAEAVYELDARISTRTLPACGTLISSSRRLLARGAHPRLAAEGDFVWFDAAAEDGRRQIHRLDRATGAVVCWTCGEGGNNTRPSPGEGRRSVAFETDRFVTWDEPRNREIQLVGASGDVPATPSIRLTIDAADDHAPVLGPGGGLLVWSRQEAGRQQLVGAGIRGGHGGILLGAPATVAAGGLSAVTPLFWSVDARSLVLVRGNPFGVGEASALDPATGRETPLGSEVAPVSGGASADGGWIALSTSKPSGLLAHAPRWLGFLLAPAASVFRLDFPVLAGTGVRTGEPMAPGAALDLGEIAAWGAPTGVSLDPSGRSLVLGQSRSTPDGVEERILDVTLDCAAGTP